MRRLINEPLTLFLLIGAGFFTLYAFLPAEEEGSEPIVVDDGYVLHMAASWTQQMGRPPSREELDKLVTHAVEQDLLYREALSRGMERDDEIVKRRMAQKMRFFLADLEELSEPTEEILQQYYQNHKDNYQSEPRYTFSHIYFSPDTRENPHFDAQQSLRDHGNDLSSEDGDRLGIPKEFDMATAGEVMATMGVAFTEQLADLPTGQWTGPVNSGYGWHLVRIDEMKPSAPIPMDQCREQVYMDFRRWQEEKAYGRLIDDLRRKYTVKYELEEFDAILDTP